ncbi:MAG: response regulator [Methanocellales archaeon]
MNKKIMIVEDDEEVRELYIAMLEESYSIIPADSGRECLKKLGIEKPDLILLDILMPDMNGWQVLERIKENIEMGEIPVIMLSALLPEASALDKEIAGYLTKPVSKQMLARAIESAFKLRDLIREYKAALNSQINSIQIEEHKNKIQQFKKTLLSASKLQLKIESQAT